ncbi:MAG: selenocysteine-specific translation elongation factor [Nitrospinae bacterium]|nr:selenocysteine-specific translation elongation factor [Nitrospinota bacterium]
MNNNTTPMVLPVMVGTAGHVDHGKTSLVRNLTGFDTDRLREEKERGLSIDIGVAPCRLPDGRMAGIIDVPGHLDFIRNMVAGASSIDVLILVIAADDGVMPQTKEHLEIVRMLRAPRVMAVLTKIDLVDKAALELARAEAAGFLNASGFPDAPVVGVSNQTGEGMDDVRKTVERLVAEVGRPRDARAFRMSVRNCFLMKGHGAVLTGVPVCGEVKLGADLEILPTGTQTSLRSVQNYRHATDTAQEGISAGLNLRDVSPGDIKRGMIVAVPNIYKPTASAIVFFRNASDGFTFRRATEVRFHCGTSATPAGGKLIGKKELPPGETAFMRIKFREPLVAAAGDRFLLRRLSPSATLGGGVVLSARDYLPQRTSPFLTQRLRLAQEALENQDYFLSELLAGPEPTLQTPELLRLTQRPVQEAEKLVEEKQKRGEIKDLGGGGWLATARINEVRLNIKNRLIHYHEDNKYTWGMEPGYVCKLLGLDPASFEKLFSAIGGAKEFAVRHGRLALKDFQPAIDARLIKLRDRILERLAQSSPNWTARNTLAGELGIARADMKILLKLLQEEGSIHTMGNYFLLPGSLDHCRETLLRLFSRTPEVEVGMFREAAGLSRNPAIAILEAFDSEGLTRRVGDTRVLMKSRSGKNSKIEAQTGNREL